MKSANWSSWAILLWLVARPAAPQAEVAALARGLEPLTTTTDVRLTRFASFEEEARIDVGTTLEPGDLLASTSGEIDLALTCPEGTVLRFSGSFRVLIDVPGSESDCALNFLSGTLDVLTDQPTEVNAGGVVLGSEGTQYSVVIVRGPRGAAQRCSVYDGRVAWSYSAGERRWLDGGMRLDLGPGRLEEGEIRSDELARVATRYARFDVAGSLAAGQQHADPQAATASLARLHYKVLAEPRDTSRRVDLARAQIDMKVLDQANYNLERGGLRTQLERRRHQIELEPTLRPNRDDNE